MLAEEIGEHVLDPEILAQLLDSSRSALDRFEHLADGRIEPRRRLGAHRVWQTWPHNRNEYFLFIDESGHPSPTFDPKFPMFCVSGVIVYRPHYDEIDRQWKDWKASFLGTADVLVHEPDVRKRSGKFYRASPDEVVVLETALSKQLDGLDFTLITAGIHKQRFVDAHPGGQVDAFLPHGQYLMCIDFLLERFAHFLWHVGDHARGLIVAEARGDKEDVLVQAELTGLQLHGTQFMPSRDFRYLIHPSIRFVPKVENHSGLQVADLLARPAAELMLNPTVRPARSEIVLKKLYDGCVGRPESYGLKCYPAQDFSELFG